jgi:hypothetical protein
MVTEGIERFNKIVSLCGFYVDEESKKVLANPELMKHTPVFAFISEDQFNEHNGFIMSMIDECVYACLNTDDFTDGKEFVFTGAVPAWTYTDEMLIEHLGELAKNYKDFFVKKKLLKINEMFE